jgi:hypothetical protein
MDDQVHNELRLLDQVQAHWQVQERPFVSTVPVVGLFIARFREAWNSVSTKWYVRLLLEQQNLFNRLVKDQLVEHAQLLAEHDQRLILQDRDATALTRELAEVRIRVHQLEQRLEALERSE